MRRELRTQGRERRSGQIFSTAGFASFELLPAAVDREELIYDL